MNSAFKELLGILLSLKLGVSLKVKLLKYLPNLKVRIQEEVLRIDLHII
jgi:hypothetical protein